MKYNLPGKLCGEKLKYLAVKCEGWVMTPKPEAGTKKGKNQLVWLCLSITTSKFAPFLFFSLSCFPFLFLRMGYYSTPHPIAPAAHQEIAGIPSCEI
jgi:hypothetical protein